MHMTHGNFPQMKAELGDKTPDEISVLAAAAAAETHSRCGSAALPHNGNSEDTVREMRALHAITLDRS